MGFFFWASNSRWAKVQCTRSTVRDNVSQYAMQELLVSKLSKKCVMGARLIDKQDASRYNLRMRAMCNLMICELKMWPSFSIQWMYCSQGLCEGATPGHKQRLQVMSRGQCRLVTQRGKLLGLDALCTPCQPLIIDQFWFFTLPQSVMGRSDCQLLRLHILVPPLPHFS